MTDTGADRPLLQVRKLATWLYAGDAVELFDDVFDLVGDQLHGIVERRDLDERKPLRTLSHEAHVGAHPSRVVISKVRCPS